MNLLDIVIVAVLAFYMICGMYRGSITSWLSTAGFMGAFYGAKELYPRVANLALSNTTLLAVLNQYLEPETFFKSHSQAITAVADVVAGGEAAIQQAVNSIGKNLAIISDAFEFNIRSQMFQNLGIVNLSEYLDQTIWMAVFNVFAFFLCFIALYVAISLFVNLLDRVICWPLFLGGFVDSLIGGIGGIMRGLWVALFLIILVPPLVTIISPEFSAMIVDGSQLYSFISQMDFLDIGTMIRTLIGG